MALRCTAAHGAVTNCERAISAVRHSQDHAGSGIMRAVRARRGVSLLLLVLVGAACSDSGNRDTRGMCAFARTTKQESLVDVKRDWAAAAAEYPHADSRLLSAAQLIDKAVISERAL